MGWFLTTSVPNWIPASKKPIVMFLQVKGIKERQQYFCWGCLRFRKSNQCNSSCCSSLYRSCCGDVTEQSDRSIANDWKPQMTAESLQIMPIKI